MKKSLLTQKPERKPHVAYNSGNNEWYTPAEYISAARRVMGGIDLDPASSDKANEVVQASKYYTIQDDGLTKAWHGRIWLNPPYERKLILRFIEKLCFHATHNDISEAIILVNNATETAWFNSLIGVATAIVFPRERVKFYTPDGIMAAPLQGQAVIYVGSKPSVFLETLSTFGWGAFI